MTSANLKAALEDVRRQLGNAVQELHKWNFEVYRLQGLVKTLAANVHDAEKAEAMQQWMQYQMTVTDAVESIINGSSSMLAPSDVKGNLLFHGYDIGRYANPAAMVHQTLKRLAQSGRIKEFRGRYMRNDLNQWLMAGVGKLSDMR